MCALVKTAAMIILSAWMNSIWKIATKKLFFGMKVDLNLTFNSHIKTSYTKAGQKLCSFLRISNYLDQKKNNFSIDQ